MSDLAKWLGDGLKALAATPVSLFLAVFIVGLLVLYAPPVPGLGLEVVRSKAGPWVGLITVAAGVFVRGADSGFRRLQRHKAWAGLVG